MYQVLPKTVLDTSSPGGLERTAPGRVRGLGFVRCPRTRPAGCAVSESRSCGTARLCAVAATYCDAVPCATPEWSRLARPGRRDSELLVLVTCRLLGHVCMRQVAAAQQLSTGGAIHCPGRSQRQTLARGTSRCRWYRARGTTASVVIAVARRDDAGVCLLTRQ